MCKITSKAFIIITSVIFWGAAAGLIFAGAWVYKEYHHYNLIAESLYTLVPATILMAVGVFFFLLGIVGGIGACKEQKCLLGLFFTILLVVLVGMVTAAVLGFFKRAEVESTVEAGIKEGMNKYSFPNATQWKDQIDFMQSELKCCGLYNYTDWYSTPTKKYPGSCCVNNSCSYPKHGLDPYLYNDGTGCYQKVKKQFLEHLSVVAGVAVAFAVLLILGMVCSCILICKRRSEVPYIGLHDADGMRV